MASFQAFIVVIGGYIEDVGIGRELFFKLRDNHACLGEALGGDMALGQRKAGESAIVAAGESFGQFRNTGFALAGSGFG